MERKEILVADKITKIYGIGTKTLFEALHEVSLTMYEGEFVCIMGPSGAGKSTFINNLSTIDIPTKGKVFINGKEVRVMSEGEIGKFRYENLGFIFQEFNLLDSLTIFENIAVPLTLANVNKKEITQRVQEVAKKLNVEQTLDKFPNECSGGQRQRVAICRALVTNPKLIVADEPTSALDLSVQAQVLNFMKHIQQQYNIAYLFISHDLGVVKHMSENLAIMHRGRLVELGSREEIYKHPIHIYTKRLLSAIPKVDVEHREEHKKHREQVEKEFEEDQSKWYDKDGRVYPLQKVAPNHWVALPQDMVQEAKLEEREEKESD